MINELKYIEMMRSDSKEAFECLFRKYYHTLVIFANQFLRNRDVAEDLVQTFFCSMWDNRNTLSTITSVKSYLFVSIKNSTLNYIKYNEKFLRNENVQQIIDELHATEPSEIDELEIAVINVISKLSEKEREVFLLHYKEGYSYPEIANMLDISINTVKTHVLRTKKILRGNLLMILIGIGV